MSLKPNNVLKVGNTDHSLLRTTLFLMVLLGFQQKQFVVMFVIICKLKNVSQKWEVENKESGCEKSLILITLMNHMCITERDGRSQWGYILLTLLKGCEYRTFQADFLQTQAKTTKF